MYLGLSNLSLVSPQVGWNPSMLFAAGEKGAWYDANDLSTLYQNSGGTTPATALNDPLGLVKDKSGNGLDASQATGTARPLLKSANGRRFIDFDGVDDQLTTTFPNLGNNVTIGRSVPGVGASILTGQTIGAGARNDSTDYHALVIIDRALTAAETAALTRYLNASAGV